MKKYSTELIALVYLVFILAFFVVGLRTINALSQSTPKTVHVLVLDQRALSSKVALEVANKLCERYLIAEIYWVFNISDTSYYKAMKSIKRADFCKVMAANCLGGAVASAYFTMFNKYKEYEKKLYILPSAKADKHDEELINALPRQGVTIFELDSLATEKRVSGT